MRHFHSNCNDSNLSYKAREVHALLFSTASVDLVHPGVPKPDWVPLMFGLLRQQLKERLARVTLSCKQQDLDRLQESLDLMYVSLESPQQAGRYLGPGP